MSDHIRDAQSPIEVVYERDCLRAEVARLRALLRDARVYVEGPHYIDEYGTPLGEEYDRSPALLARIDAALAGGGAEGVDEESVTAASAVQPDAPAGAGKTSDTAPSAAPPMPNPAQALAEALRDTQQMLGIVFPRVHGRQGEIVARRMRLNQAALDAYEAALSGEQLERELFLAWRPVRFVWGTDGNPWHADKALCQALRRQWEGWRARAALASSDADPENLQMRVKLNTIRAMLTEGPLDTALVGVRRLLSIDEPDAQEGSTP